MSSHYASRNLDPADSPMRVQLYKYEDDMERLARAHVAAIDMQGFGFITKEQRIDIQAKVQADIKRLTDFHTAWMASWANTRAERLASEIKQEE